MPRLKPPTHLPARSPSGPLDPPQRAASLPEPALAAEAVANVLRPLARLMIDHGLQLPSMVELLKQALVDEAAVAYGLGEKGSSDTRIALLTGVHRKDVKRLREAGKMLATPVPMVPVAASVVARWISEPRYLNADQTTRALARTPGRGHAGETDFTTLVAEVSRDLGARAVLDELVRLGVVELREDGYVVLRTAGFVPHEGLSESFHFLAANVRDHLAAAVHNLAPDRRGPPMLEQSAFAGGLTQEQVDQLHQQARHLWASAVRQFLQSATVAKQRSQDIDEAKHDIRFGVYFNASPQVDTAAGPYSNAKAPRSRRKRSKP